MREIVPGVEHVRRARLGLAVALVTLVLPLTGCTLSPQFFACLLSGDLSSADCRSDAVAPGAPSAPRDLTATAVDTGDRIPDVLLDWRDSLEGDVVGYTVYRSDTPGGPYDFAGFVGFAAPPPPSTFTDGCLFGDSFCVLETCTMYYVVTATDELFHEGPYSNEASVRLDCEPPGPPTGLTATPLPDGGALRLTWSDPPEPDVDGFHVYRAVGGGPFERLTSSPQFSTIYTDRGLDAGTVYSYRVTALDRAGNEGEPSAVVTASPLPAPDREPPAVPTGLAAIAGDGSVALDWDDNVEPDFLEYVLVRRSAPDAPGGVGFVLAESEYVDTGLPNGTTVWYQVRARDRSGNLSEFSDLVAATPGSAAPAAPTGLTATPGRFSVALDWADNGEPDLAGYRVYLSFSAAGPFFVNDEVSVSQAVVFDLPSTVDAFFYVTAVDTDGLESPPSAIVSARACGGVGCFPSFASFESFSLLAAPSSAPGAFPFTLTVRGGYVSGGTNGRDGGTITGSGLRFAGSFTLEATAGSRLGRELGQRLREGVTGDWSATMEWRLTPGERAGTATGVALATFADPALGTACLRFEQAMAGRDGRVKTRGTLTMLGGTAAAAQLLGRGTYDLRIGADGSMVYRGHARADEDVPPVPPAECAAAAAAG